MNEKLKYSARIIVFLISITVICYCLGWHGFADLLMMFTVMVSIWLCVVINCPHPENYNRWTKPTDRY